MKEQFLYNISADEELVEVGWPDDLGVGRRCFSVRPEPHRLT